MIDRQTMVKFDRLLKGQGIADADRETLPAAYQLLIRQRRAFATIQRMPVIDLCIRSHGDSIKRGWLHEARAQNRVSHLVFDARRRVVHMWRHEGVRCCQVAPGDF